MRGAARFSAGLTVSLVGLFSGQILGPIPTAEAAVPQHWGANDPLDQGWFAFWEDTPHGPVEPDSGTDSNGSSYSEDAWRINDADDGKNYCAYGHWLTDEEEAELADGWILSAYVRVGGGPDLHTADTRFQYTGNGKRWLLEIGTDANSDPVVYLYFGKHTVTLPGIGDGYHLYELKDLNGDHTADLYVDGELVYADYATPEDDDLKLFYWGDGFTGATGADTYYSMVKLVAATDGQPDMGDADGDGDIDDNDLSLLLANWGHDTDWGHGEFTGVAPVNDDDLSLLLANWTGSTAVPEPATLSVLAIAGSVLLRHKRRS